MGGGGWSGVVVWVGGNRKRKKPKANYATSWPTLQLCNDHLHNFLIFDYFFLFIYFSPFFSFCLTSIKTTENDKNYHSCINTKQTSNKPNHYFTAGWQQENSTTTYITQQPLKPVIRTWKFRSIRQKEEVVQQWSRLFQTQVGEVIGRPAAANRTPLIPSSLAMVLPLAAEVTVCLSPSTSARDADRLHQSHCGQKVPWW